MSSHKVFISYTHDDEEWVRAFADALREEQVDIWLDQWDVKLGESLREAIEAGLRESDTIVAVVSPANVRSPNVFFELGVAIGMGKRLIPVVSEDLAVSSIPFDLRTRRYVIQGSPAETARQVASAVKETTGSRGGPN